MIHITVSRMNVKVQAFWKDLEYKNYVISIISPWVGKASLMMQGMPKVIKLVIYVLKILLCLILRISY